jgi:hypothetical protein
MDVAHGRHARYLRFAPQPFTEFRDCFDNFHRLGPRRDGESRGRVHLLSAIPRLRPRPPLLSFSAAEEFTRPAHFGNAAQQ